MQIKKITVIGAGTMGAQIALQIAKYGYDVRMYARYPERFQKTLMDLRSFLPGRDRIPAPALEEWLKGAENVRIYSDLKEALQEADLVIEAVSENLELKRKMFSLIDSMAPRDAILSTTSSSIPVSQIADETQRFDRCINLHFYQPPLLIHMAEIMGGTRTATDVMETTEKFIQSIGCIPLIIKKELLGVGFVRVLHCIYQQTLSLWADGYMDYRDIDRAWMIFTQMPQGPFGLMDTIGLDVLFDVLLVYYNETQSPKDHPPQALKDMIDRRELGRKTGKGFYTYPQPEYTRPDFLRR
jgi:3-hydroxybutyryl-CoA dehydrogenase